MSSSSASLDVQDHFHACWRLSSCHPCIHSNASCGWCAVSATCVPASNLLSPITNPHICPLKDERFELRTGTLGCGCSTTTFLSIIVTVFATLVAAGLLYGFFRAVGAAWHVYVAGSWRGIEIETKDGPEGRLRVEREWKRRTWLGRKVRDVAGRNTMDPNSNLSEQEQITERSRLLG